ncbi:actin-like ATPase domain-containing protein [Hortaea werneckii]|nr:actin-like ATPase domain-containing protein [Hortaea werneckii]KAI7570947.1 actin-like ATPase domain-containing protein [Hortaea werneckii]KAI7618943.1 actin-like ATPase domain-containing protein [Hortaea werneckii]KAI7635013.1 actin-like ATPase domain-containing protein [Hortaea werneckii]KAI7674895.1 actin-like ATPase domain-containing protein [Hortaea werneckii]
MAPKLTPTDRLVVGIDFGTTFSGVAAAYSANPEAPDEINIIKSWPGGNNVTSDKVPSEIAYGEVAQSPIQKKPFEDPFDFNPFSTDLDTSQLEAGTTESGGTMRWGYQIRSDEQRLRCLKLLLDPAQPLPAYVSLDDIQQQLTATQKNVGTAVAEYPTSLFDHTKEVLNRRYGEFFVATTKLQVVLTVPAVWSDKAQDATVKAAEAAGMGSDIMVISEPEAAAVYALQAIQPNNLKIGHNFVVVDAGGGTVDLITYSITQLTPLRLEEVVRGSGGCCGAAFLNVRFEDFIRQKLGSRVFQQLRTKKPRSLLVALKYFEDYVKRTFDPQQDDMFNVPFPGVEDNIEAGVDSGFLCMDTADMRSVRAMGKSVNALMLVGGFGQSEYLLKSLRSRFNVEIMQPVNAWTAVVRGAVLRGLEGQELVISRKARRHYGVKMKTPFNSSIHPDKVKYWDPLEESLWATNQMTWYIKKGETVSSDESVLFPFYRCFNSGESRIALDNLIVCEDDVAPTYASNKTRTACELMVDLNDVPECFWKSAYNSRGIRYQRLSYHLGMQITSGGIHFDFRVDGVVYGEVTASFD